MWMMVKPMLALGSVELIGVENALSHGKNRKIKESLKIGKEEVK